MAQAVRDTPSSGSIRNPTYWWYRARAELLRTVFEQLLGDDPTILDIGSADGPSVGWMPGRRVAVDVNLDGLGPGGVCASGLALPFGDASFDVVSAFDVIEHFAGDDALATELGRVLRPGAWLLASVPAYRWAWSSHDVAAGHHRRYTRRSIVALLEANGFEVRRATYAFAGTFPFFAADRVRARLTRRDAARVDDTSISPRVERVLMGLSRLDERVLRRRNLPFGSSVFVAARRAR